MQSCQLLPVWPATTSTRTGFRGFRVPEHIHLRLGPSQPSKSPIVKSHQEGRRHPPVRTQALGACKTHRRIERERERAWRRRSSPLGNAAPIPVVRAMPPGPLSPSTSSLAERRHHGMPQWALSSFPLPAGAMRVMLDNTAFLEASMAVAGAGHPHAEPALVPAVSACDDDDDGWRRWWFCFARIPVRSPLRYSRSDRPPPSMTRHWNAHAGAVLETI
ncbi:hypothetical protein EDB81DRAFT_6768 [Dactylonectria macrodidyma]|uniref:Uncharacterized protein n=1 Tax=Dactylonectria macrodidyma TaxID=307937 RepID=A0A9P9JIE9_9HYPO|nr:hypothetical protein EDB81DRAFT_6768 [Dactylonectria macrodidyma]